jgi:hypothetical protein
MTATYTPPLPVAYPLEADTSRLGWWTSVHLPRRLLVPSTWARSEQIGHTPVPSSWISGVLVAYYAGTALLFSMYIYSAVVHEPHVAKIGIYGGTLPCDVS